MFDELKLFIITLLSLYVLFVSLRPSYPNPDFILILHKNPILIILLFIFALYSFNFDQRIGFLLLIILFGIYFDIISIIKRDVTI
tara:strand:- start:13512 stop:13766 length:255 start_codon:yes stop_codon:yes gene_type:complete